jgi:hypothetical protein
METFKIWALCVAAAIAYGILHDQVTARICVEYFSVAHPTILPLTSPTLLALQWGILATWWGGAMLGILLAIAARAGSRQTLSARDLYYPLLILLLCMAASSAAAGATGFLLTRAHAISLEGQLAAAIPAANQARFMADWWAHAASYLVGIVGGLVVCVKTYARRSTIPPVGA